VKKAEEDLRFCVNYWDLNAIIIKNRYSLFLIFEILNRLSRVKIFIKLDIIAAFNRLHIREKDEFLIAFYTRFELFKYLVMLFNLCNESVSFQNYINDTLCKYLDEFCTAYLDDILIYSDNEVEHEIHVNHVLQKLAQADLQIDIIKCAFHVIEVSYLDLIIIIKEVKMNSAKVNIIVNWFTLVNVKNVQSFLDFINFYRRFIYDYSKIAASLTRLTRKNVMFEWFTDCQAVFDTLKKVFTSDVILHHYNSDLQLVVEINASDYVSEDILSQYNKNDVLHLVTYFFKKHNSVECNYEIYDKELMIIVCIFEEWCFELEDSSTSIEMITNHKNLEYFMSTKQLSHHQARWSEFLSRFNYRIIYHSEKVESKSDVLTRWSDDLSKKRNTQNSRHLHQHQTVLKSHVLDLRIQEDLQNLVFELRIIDLQCRIIALDFIQLHLVLLQSLSFIALVSMNLEFEELELEVEDSESQLDQETLDSEEDSVNVLTQTLWNQVEDSDKFASQILEALRKRVRYHSKISLAECENLDNFLYFRDRKYVSNFNHLRLWIIQLAHDSVADEHSERAKCYNLVSRVY